MMSDYEVTLINDNSQCPLNLAWGNLSHPAYSWILADNVQCTWQVMSRKNRGLAIDNALDIGKSFMSHSKGLLRVRYPYCHPQAGFHQRSPTVPRQCPTRG